MGALKMSDILLFLGRLSWAHFAAFFCLCLAKHELCTYTKSNGVGEC